MQPPTDESVARSSITHLVTYIEHLTVTPGSTAMNGRSTAGEGIVMRANRGDDHSRNEGPGGEQPEFLCYQGVTGSADVQHREAGLFIHMG